MMKEQKSLKETTYQAILHGILNGEYKPNQILTEQEMVLRYGCSKSPVREALITLCNEGILKNLPRYGYEVIRLTKENVEEIMEYRRILETGFLKKIIGNMDESKISLLTDMSLACMEPTRDIWAHWEANTRFHCALLSFSDNRYATEELNKSMHILKRAYAQFYLNSWNTAIPSIDVKNHALIIEALKKKDLTATKSGIHKDLEDFCI